MRIVYNPKDTEARRATTAADSAAGEMMATAAIVGDAGTTASDNDEAAAAETDEEPEASSRYLVSLGDGAAEEEKFKEGDAQFGVDNEGILYQVIAQIRNAYEVPPVGGRSDKPGNR